MSDPLSNLSAELAATVERVSQNAVAVVGGARFGASGFFLRENVVVTSAHALRGAEELQVTLPDGERKPGKLAGSDPGTDVAVLRVEASATLRIEAAEPSEARPGALALAVGRSPDVGTLAAFGVVSAVSRGWRTWRGGWIDRYTRLDLRLYPGLAGAAVVDVGGKLLGLASPALSRLAPLAVPLETIERVAAELLEAGHVRRGYLGIGLQPVALPAVHSESLGRQRALLVVSIEPGQPADSAGFLIGDILLAIDGKRADDTDDVQATLGGDSIGRPLDAEILRGGEPRRLTVTPRERPSGGD